MKSWARPSLACWSATSALPITTMTAPSNAAGLICSGTSTTCGSSTQMMTGWAGGQRPSTNLYRQATSFTHPSDQLRLTAQLALERRLLALCHPFLNDPSVVQAKLCRRVENHIKGLFVFVVHSEVPPDNNAAERSLRHLVVSRKVSGGTRSNPGTDTKMTLASIFGTWRAQGSNTLTACQQLLTSPQL